ncbi:MAG: hypothetical protein IJX78_00820 [Bacilli bacterium]|nr:hypothetical protein [Bacilli bacterium]
MLTSEYARPLVGKPYYRNIGIIKVYDRHNRNYSVGEIIFERFDDQNFQYIIKPYWKFIDQIPHGLFQGIPGIDMDLKKEAYYRVNMTPTFISMRTPSESRENVRELMKSVGLDYYDRFEWLLRSEMRCGDDNLIVVRKPTDNLRIQSMEQVKNRYFHPGDVIEIDNLCDIKSSNAKLIEHLFGLLHSGVKIYIKSENRYIDDNERRTMLYLLRNMLECIDRNNRNRREEGIEEAKRNGRYTGRKPIKLDEQFLKQVAITFLNNRISEQEAMNKLGINSRSTFYRKIKIFRT